MTVIKMKGAKEAPRAIRSSMETMELTQSTLSSWKSPPFQRPLKKNAKVIAISEELQQEGNNVINGVISLGRIKGESAVYVIDGQHRVLAAQLSGLATVYADVRISDFDNMAEMGEEFVKLNSAIVRMNPDDILKGMEGTLPVIHNIRTTCPFVGYDHIRKHESSSPVVSVSVAVRSWAGSAREVPSNTGMGSALEIVRGLTIQDADQLCQFLKTAFTAWGREPQNYRLWGALNLAVTMWTWRQHVLNTDRSGRKKHIVLSQDLFKKCMMHMAASGNYNDWLVGRNTGERDRSPCYARIRDIFTERLRQELPGKKIMLMQPSWSS